jgi:hypothetical protein
VDKELETANEMGTADVSGGFSHYKEEVYNVFENFFNWLSVHQGLAIIIIVGVLGIVTYFFLRFRKYSKQIEKKVSSQKTEIGKKDALIEEQKNKLAALQKKLSDQQAVVTESLLGTLMTLTGYNLDQLRIFFKFLTEISGNPLQIDDAQSNTMPASGRLEEESDDSPEENDGNEKNVPGTVPEEVVEADKEVVEANKEVIEADKEVVEADKEVIEADKEVIEADKEVVEADKRGKE